MLFRSGGVSVERVIEGISYKSKTLRGLGPVDNVEVGVVGTHSPPEITALISYQKLALLDTPIVGTGLLLGHASCGAGVAPSLGGRFTSMLINERPDYSI